MLSTPCRTLFRVKPINDEIIFKDGGHIEINTGSFYNQKVCVSI